MTSSRILYLVAAFAIIGAFTAPARAQQTDSLGAYRDFTPQQRALIDDWVRRFVQVTGQDVEPETFYTDLVRFSTKTTFGAVTHALMQTTLTDDSGAPIGTALDLVAALETVRGKVKGASGDQQFRMYVVLKPDAVETLDESREFKRGADNTIFHRGYPTNYRQQGGVPSIQISIARDGRRHRRRLSFVVVPGRTLQRALECVELRRTRGRQRRPPQRTLGGSQELVAGAVRRSVPQSI